MKMTALTKAERKLRSEVEQIASAVEMDVWNIEQHERGAGRAYHLKSHEGQAGAKRSGY